MINRRVTKVAFWVFLGLAAFGAFVALLVTPAFGDESIGTPSHFACSPIPDEHRHLIVARAA